jgi:hypothetical protein
LKEPLSPIEDNAGGDHDSPEDRGPNTKRTAEEPCDDDGEQEARVSAKKEDGSTDESEHWSNGRYPKLRKHTAQLKVVHLTWPP